MRPRESHHPPAAREEILVADLDHGSERRLGRRQPDAQERQRRLRDDGERQIDGGDDEHRREHVRQHVPEHDGHGAHADEPRAACTYSLLRSTRVMLRTVRAYCTQ